MREILFRGKTNYEGKDTEWVYGGLLPESASTFPIIVRDYDNDEEWIGILDWATVDPETVGQYTGLTDKNGKKIFEGDIIKHHRRLWGEDISDIGVVFWNAGTCQYRRTSSQNGETPQVWQSTTEQYEVIGNIHDNPELLK